jgi:hypothetical protein
LSPLPDPEKAVAPRFGQRYSKNEYLCTLGNI